MRRGCDPARAKHGGNIEEEEVTKAHRAAKLLFGIC